MDGKTKCIVCADIFFCFLLCITIIESLSIGRWITFLVAQVVALANLEKSLGQISGFWLFCCFAIFGCSSKPPGLLQPCMMVCSIYISIHQWLTVLFITSSTCMAPPRCPAHLWMGNLVRGSLLTTPMALRTLHHWNHRGPQRRKTCPGEELHSPKRTWWCVRHFWILAKTLLLVIVCNVF